MKFRRSHRYTAEELSSTESGAHSSWNTTDYLVLRKGVNDIMGEGLTFSNKLTALRYALDDMDETGDDETGDDETFQALRAIEQQIIAKRSDLNTPPIFGEDYYEGYWGPFFARARCVLRSLYLASPVIR